MLNVVGDSYKDFIVQLMNITPTAANCKMYVDIVKQQSRVLKLRDTGLALSRISTEEEGAELLANAASETVRDDGDVWSLAQGFFRLDAPIPEKARLSGLVYPSASADDSGGEKRLLHCGRQAFGG